MFNPEEYKHKLQLVGRPYFILSKEKISPEEGEKLYAEHLKKIAAQKPSVKTLSDGKKLIKKPRQIKNTDMTAFYLDNGELKEN